MKFFLGFSIVLLTHAITFYGGYCAGVSKPKQFEVIPMDPLVYRIPAKQEHKLTVSF